VIKSLLIYATQIFAVAAVGYVLWYFLYGTPDVPFFVWILICVGAGLLGLIPYLLWSLWQAR
jgi:hypothetical protein